jgi:hypothetical protein
MLATQPPTDHFNPAPHQQRVLPSADTRGAIETLVEADHAAPKLNEEDPFVQDLLRDGVSKRNRRDLSTSWFIPETRN